MTDISSNTWKELDADNTSNPPTGLPLGTDANKLYPVVHAIMGATKRDYTQSNPVYTSTGTAAARVYNLNFSGGIESPAPMGKTIRFNPNFTNVAGIHSLNINGQVYSLKRPDGTNLIAGDIKVGYPVEIVSVGGAVFNLQNPRNIDDNRLPSTMTSKTISGSLTLQNGQVLVRSGAPIIQMQESDNSDKNWFMVVDGGNWSIRENTTGNTRLSITAGTATTSLKMDGNTVWTAGNGGAGSGLDADKLDGQEGAYYLARANGTGTQPISTVAGLQAAIDAQVTKAGDTMTGALGVAVALGTGATTNALVAVRNTQNGDAIITMGANNRTTSLSTIGQRANGNTFISTNTATWELRTDKHIYLPDGGRLLSNGDVYNTTYSTNLTTIINRSSNVRLSREQYQAVNANGWNVVPTGAVITALYRGGNGQIEGMNFRYLHQTDINGTWQFVGVEP